MLDSGRFLLGLLFCDEDWGDILLRNVGLFPNFTALLARTPSLHGLNIVLVHTYNIYITAFCDMMLRSLADGRRQVPQKHW
jgi:hypothetical protein